MTDGKVSSSTIMIREGESIVSDEAEICELFNEYFCTVAESIGIPDSLGPDESVVAITERHKDHPSVISITDRNSQIRSFSFTAVDEKQIEKQISILNPKKATGYDKLPPKIIKLCAPELAPSFTKIVNNSLTQGVFPTDFKKAEIVPIFKKKTIYVRKIIDPSAFCPHFLKY